MTGWRGRAALCGALAAASLPGPAAAASLPGPAAAASLPGPAAVATLAGPVAAASLPGPAEFVPAEFVPAEFVPAEIVPAGPSVLRNAGLDACLTAVSAAAVLMEACDGGPRQVFRIQPSGAAGNIMIRHNGWCVQTGPGAAIRNPARLGHCTGETSFHPTSLWRDSRFVLYGTAGPSYYPLRAGQVGEPPFVTWAKDAPGEFQEWRILPAS